APSGRRRAPRRGRGPCRRTDPRRRRRLRERLACACPRSAPSRLNSHSTATFRRQDVLKMPKEGSMMTTTVPHSGANPPRGLDSGPRLQLIRPGSEESVMRQEDTLEAALARDLDGTFARLVRAYTSRPYSC